MQSRASCLIPPDRALSDGICVRQGLQAPGHESRGMVDRAFVSITLASRAPYSTLDASSVRHASSRLAGKERDAAWQQLNKIKCPVAAHPV